MTGQATRLDVVVLSCGDLGVEVANRLRTAQGVRRVCLVTAPYRRKRLGLRGKVREVYRAQGLRGLVAALARKLLQPLRRRRSSEPDSPPTEALHPDIRHMHFSDFHSAECVEALRALAPDLGVVAGTYILKPEVFDVPRLGSVNLHSGKVPEYRGSAPAFWELYHAEPVVGITIHRVTSALDAGNVLRQELFPLDSAPEGDPVAYIQRYRREVLRPNGVRMLAEVVAALAAGTSAERPQEHAHARTFKSPDHDAVRVETGRHRLRHPQAADAKTGADQQDGG